MTCTAGPRARASAPVRSIVGLPISPGLLPSSYSPRTEKNQASSLVLPHPPELPLTTAISREPVGYKLSKQDLPEKSHKPQARLIAHPGTDCHP